MIPPGVFEKVAASAAYDVLKASAKRLGGAPEELARAVERSFQAAAKRFSTEYEARHPKLDDTFIARASNWERVLDSVRFSAPPLTTSDLSPKGFNGDPDATEEELGFFIRAVLEEMGKEPILDRLLAERTAMGHLAQIAENTSLRRLPGWTLNELVRLSSQSRRVLDPYLLPRVPRGLVARDYLPALQSGLGAEIGAILAIVGPAGYGKSTLLGQLYDELPRLQPAWTGLLLCADVDHHEGAPAEELSREMGRALVGTSVPLHEVSASLNGERGRGVLLVDTLDLVLSEKTARSLRHILSEVAATGTSIAFTCREHEYDEHLAPSGGTGSGRAQAFQRFRVPWFTRDEVVLAARSLIEQKPGSRRRQTPDEFASRLLAISADNRSLRHIIYNPLLLALLCELFDDALAIPADLTVSRLYDRYWAEKVARGRMGDAAVGRAKAALCLRLAEVLYLRSGELLAEMAAQEELEVNAGAETPGHRELVSEGVYGAVPPSGRLRFFHQTFLEYAIARWLLLPANSERLRDLLAGLRQPGEHGCLHWWPVVRQLLVMADRAQTDPVLEQLDLTNVAAYRVVALAAVAMERADVLRKLVPLALGAQVGFRKALLFALAAPSPAFFPETWDVALKLLARSEGQAGAMQVLEPIGELLSLAEGDVAAPLREVTATLDAWAREHVEQGGNAADHGIALGTFLNTALPTLERNPDAAVLAALREQLPVMGLASRVNTIRLHLLPAAPAGAREALLRQMLEGEVDGNIAEQLEPLFSGFAPWTALGAESRFWPSWQEALYAPLPSGWELVRSRSAGRAAARDPALLRAIIDDFFSGPKAHIHINILALHAAVLTGGGDAVCEAFVATPPGVIGDERFSGISALARHVAHSLSTAQRNRLSEWLRRLAPSAVSQAWVIAVATLAADDESLGFATARLAELPMDERVHAITTALRGTTADLGSVLVRWLQSQPGFAPHTSAAMEMRLAFHRLRAREGDERSLREIVLSAGSSEAALARKAAKALLDMALEPVRPGVHALLPLARSPVPVVRKNALLVVRTQFDAGIPLAEADLVALAEAYAGEDDRMAVHALCELAGNWMLRESRAPLRVGEIVAGIVPRLTSAGTFDGGLARVVSFVFRLIAEGGGRDAVAAAGEWARHLLTVMEKGHLDNAQANVLGLLTALGRRDPEFFPSVLTLGPALPFRALRTFVVAVEKVEGIGSPLLTRIVQAEWSPTEIKRLVLGKRGG